MDYEYDPQMEATYRRSLIKLVRKSIDDRFFPFLIVDQNNEQTEHFRDIVEHAEANQFQVYFIELNSDVPICAQRNIHKRSLPDIEQVKIFSNDLYQYSHSPLDSSTLGTFTVTL